MNTTILDSTEIKDILDYFQKVTKRQQQIFITKWIADEIYFIDSIEEQIKQKDYAWHLGSKFYTSDLNVTKKNIKTLESYYKTI
jgi:hypothetical protein